jgi:Asp-tRNA(Asn)/Glu-tRNA(Gln) amidotransferase A subunit family amidase
MVRRVMARLCEDSTGLPVGVQVAALPFQDEISLRLAAELETALRSP